MEIVFRIDSVSVNKIVDLFCSKKTADIVFYTYIQNTYPSLPNTVQFYLDKVVDLQINFSTFHYCEYNKWGGAAGRGVGGGVHVYGLRNK